MATGYCSKCRANVEVDGGEEFVSKGKSKRPGIRGSCPTCGSAVIHWISKYDQIEDESQGAPEEEEVVIPSDPSVPDSSGEISIDDLQEVPPETPVPQPPAGPPQAQEEEEEEKEEEESGWMEWIPIIVVVLGIAFLFIGAWLLWSNSKKKEEEKAQAEKNAQQIERYPPGTDILPEGV